MRELKIIENIEGYSDEEVFEHGHRDPFVRSIRLERTYSKFLVCVAGGIVTLGLVNSIWPSSEAAPAGAAVANTVAATKTVTDPDDPIQLARKYNIEDLPRAYWRMADDSSTFKVANRKLTFQKSDERIVYTVREEGYRLGIFSVGHVSETTVFDYSVITCSDIVIEKNSVGKWERTEKGYGKCTATNRQKFENLQVWKRDDGAYVDLQKNVVIAADFARK